MIKLQKGMKLKTRSDLVVGERYGDVTLYGFLYENIKGIAITIKSVHDNGASIKIEEDYAGYYYSPEFFNLFITNEK